MAEENNQKQESKFISAKLLEKAQEENVVRAYNAKDVLKNITKNENGELENVPTGMSFLSTRTSNGIEGAFVETVKKD